METTCSPLKEYCLLACICSEEFPPLASLGLEGDLPSVASVSLLLSWEDDSRARRVYFSSHGLLSFSSALTLAMISSACLPFSTNCFHVWHLATPIWVRSAVCRIWRQVSTSVDCAMPLRHRSAILWNLSTNILIDSPFFCFVVRRVGTDTSVSSSKKWLRKASPDQHNSWWNLQEASWTIKRQPP